MTLLDTLQIAGPGVPPGFIPTAASLCRLCIHQLPTRVQSVVHLTWQTFPVSKLLQSQMPLSQEVTQRRVMGNSLCLGQAAQSRYRQTELPVHQVLSKTEDSCTLSELYVHHVIGRAPGVLLTGVTQFRHLAGKSRLLSTGSRERLYDHISLAGCGTHGVLLLTSEPALIYYVRAGIILCRLNSKQHLLLTIMSSP